MFSAFECLLTLVFTLWFYILWTRREFYKLIFKIPGPIGYPLLGLAHKFVKCEGILNVFNELLSNYGHFVFTWLGPFPTVVISDPQIVEDILTSPYCCDKSILYDAIKDTTGPGVFTLNYAAWRIRRKILNPIFAQNVLLTLAPTFNKNADEFLEKLYMLTGSGEVDIYDEVQKLTMNISTQTTMGVNVTHEKSGNENFIQCYRAILEQLTRMVFEPWLRFKIIQKLLGVYAPFQHYYVLLRNFILNLLDEKLNADDSLEAGDAIKPNIFINRAIDLMQARKLTLDDVQSEAPVMLVAAFETTSSALFNTLMLLAMFPQYQQKVFEELKAIYPQSGSFDVSFEETKAMLYLEMVLNETLRLMVPLPTAGRQTSANVTLSNGIALPKGVQIAIDIFHLQRNVEVWGSEAHIFNPDNFLPERVESRHPYAFIPFTKGIRNCIGQRYAMLELKIILAKLLRHYRFTTSFKFENLEFVEKLTLSLKEVPQLEVHKRDF